MLKILLASRSAHLYLGMLLLLSALSYVFHRNTVPFEFSSLHPGNRLPYPEVCGVVAGTLGVVLLRPRFWEWDRVGTRRPMVLSGGCALVGVTAPLIVVSVGSVALPDGVAWGFAAANALVYCALVFCLAPFVGGGLAGGVTMVLYFTVGALHNLAPMVAAPLPIAAYPGPEGHWLPAAVLTGVAIVLHIRTGGATAWSQRTFNKD